jgi:hypothetical protein
MAAWRPVKGGKMVGWLKKLRGLAGVTVFGGLAGAFFGVLMVVITSLYSGSGGINLFTLGSGATAWSLIGALSAGGVGLAIATVESRRSLPELSALRAAIYGGVLAAATVVGTLVLLTPGLALTNLSVGAGFGAMLGGGIGGGLIAAAKRAERGDLSAPSRRGDLPAEDQPAI